MLFPVEYRVELEVIAGVAGAFILPICRMGKRAMTWKGFHGTSA